MLMVVTLVLLAAAVTFGVMAWRLSREAERRSDARVAALVASLEAEPIEASAPASGADDLDLALIDAPTRPIAPIGATPADSDRAIFAESAHHEATGFSRLMAAAIVAGVLVTGVTVAWVAGTASEAPDAQAAAAPSIELLSLTSTRRGPDLSIAGLVRNPSAGAPLEGLSAVVLFFNESGQFLTSARAPIGQRLLTPGADSPFEVTAPAPDGASRYRVSFRFERGDVVTHVDRRTAGAPASDAPDSPAVRRAGL